MADAVNEGYHRILAPSIERETRNELKECVDEEAARVFATNLQSLLRSPLLGAKCVLTMIPDFGPAVRL